jgi:predicted dehydrogenase
MSPPHSVRVGIIGTGVGIRTLVPGFRSTGRAEIVGISGSSLARANEFARQADIPRAFGSHRELIDSEDIDLVCVASPNVHHYEQAMCAISAGKHVLVEKPLGSSMAETQALADAVKEYPKLAVVDHQLRFNPYIRAIEMLLKNGDVGEPYFIRLHQQSAAFSNREEKWNWSFDAEQSGGVLLAMGSHLVDLIWFWLGNRKVYSCDCSIDPVIPQRSDTLGAIREVKASSFFAAHLTLEPWCTAHLSTTAAAVGENRFDIDIYGTDGEIHFDLRDKLRFGSRKSIGKTATVQVAGVTDEERQNAVSIFKGSFVYFASKIVDAVATGDLSHVADACKFGDAVRTQRILDALRESGVRGTKVRIENGYSSRAVV